ncbi:MAG: bifunctional phosphopantothenoylcysteine decarboxylase/phosphopantothenate--cysteine ligase CoaBC [Gammaproteobacteria bacterium]|nr:bifunctional phosphopantothenoylcysteine decarboxylase/phosphopantothenate--cysteine ligase CoaBC [Gammaproteobacteria bacterium]MBT7370911.1 bifunctional phosphopantothenoylcysteine decarboxylase/phosphopantothenate--cysteine ligase CoaBC [Gammaproteobacteria bacterium]
MNRLTNKRILLGVTGGIAAYKSAELIRRLQDEGADVRVVMTKGSKEFITPLTLQALSGHAVHQDLLDTDTESVMGHIELARWADLIVVAPATADFVARLVAGRSDDLLTAVCLAANSPIAVAPAMNQAMWSNAATQTNIMTLKQTGCLILDPDEGLQACGETGVGRLMDVPDLVTAIAGQFQTGELQGRKVVITAGPTREAIDPVRYISNHSSGKQGYALAESAIEAGAKVVLVTGPTHLANPDRVEVIDVESACDMLDAVMAEIDDADIFIGVAAVSDFRPLNSSEQKIKKQGDNDLTLQLVQNPDILQTVAMSKDRPFTVGFAAETEAVVENARKKLAKKKLDMIIANNVADRAIGFNSDDNETIVITNQSEESLPKMSKTVLSKKLVSIIANALEPG